MKHQHFIVYVNTKNGEMLLIRPNKVKGVNRRGDLLETLLPIIFLSIFIPYWCSIPYTIYCCSKNTPING